MKKKKNIGRLQEYRIVWEDTKVLFGGDGMVLCLDKCVGYTGACVCQNLNYTGDTCAFHYM